MKEKDRRIIQVEQTFQTEKQAIEQQWQANLTNL